MPVKIILEEHFALPETLEDSANYAADGAWPRLRRQLIDSDSSLIEDMDKHSVAISVLSLNAPAVQGISDPARAIILARKANDLLAERIARNPKRLAGLAALPMLDADAAATELTRCVKELGFVGALVNGFSERDNGALYYDDPRYLQFWAVVQDLDVPFYLHPRDPLPGRTRDYEGHPWFEGPAWAFGVETAIHALRLMGNGLFDRYPRLQIILGHLGEGLPYSLWRLDQRIKRAPRGIPAEKSLSHYLATNFYLTTAGNFRTQTLICAMLEVGADRILFSVDYPFQDIGRGVAWLDSAAIGETDRDKIACLNAAKLLKLPFLG